MINSKFYYCVSVFIRLNAAAFIKFSAFRMQCLFEDGVYLEVTLLKSLKTVALNRLSILCNLKVPMSAYLLHHK